MGGRRNERLKARIRENQFRTGIFVDQAVNKSLRKLGETTSVRYVKDSSDQSSDQPIRLGLVKL